MLSYCPSGPWTSVFNDTFSNQGESTTVITEFNVHDETHVGRYFKFVCHSYYAQNCALKYIKLFGIKSESIYQKQSFYYELIHKHRCYHHCQHFNRRGGRASNWDGQLVKYKPHLGKFTHRFNRQCWAMWNRRRCAKQVKVWGRGGGGPTWESSSHFEVGRAKNCSEITTGR